MKVIVQIISKDQSEYINDMISSTQGFERLWVLDRCIDDSAELLTNLNETYLENKEGTGFLAGKVRDIGIDYLLDKDYDIIVMLDGDRIPLNLSMELIEKEMNRSDCSLALAKDDIRTIIDIEHLYTETITAGLIIKTSFLRKIRKLSFMSNRCFHHIFDGEYGEEDRFFGDCLYSVGTKIIIGDLYIEGENPTKIKGKSIIPSLEQIKRRDMLEKKLGIIR